MYPIPPNATRIRYLESTGTQYIDTGIVPTGATKVRCVFSLDNLNNFSPVFWSRGSSSTDKAFCFEGENKGQARWDYGNYGPIQVANALVAGQRYTIEVNSGTLSVAESTLQRTEQTFTGAGSIILFNFCNYVNGERQMLSVACQPVRIYGFTISSGSTLVRSYVPVRVGTTGYLFDRVSGQLFGNAGTGDFVLGPDTFTTGVLPTRMMTMGVRKRPYDAEVEYLESTGTQWIDTGVVSQANLVYDFYLTETTNNDQRRFFGFIESIPPTWLGTGMNSANWGNGWFYVNFASTETKLNIKYPNRNGLHHFDYTDGNASFSLNGNKLWTSTRTGTYSGNRHVFVFAQDYDNSSVARGIGRISYFKVTKNGNLLFDGIPVRVGTTGYLYDRANPNGGPLGNGLYGSATSTPLVAGPDKTA